MYIHTFFLICDGDIENVIFAENFADVYMSKLIM